VSEAVHNFDVETATAKESPLAVFARNTIILRDLLGWTQHDLADQSGISRATIALLESGSGDPRLSTMLRIARAFGVSLVVMLATRTEVSAMVDVGPALSSSPVAIDQQDLNRMRDSVASSQVRDWRRAARLGAIIGRSAGCTSPGAAATAGLFSVAAPGRGTAFGATLGRLLE
jgi:transcriptional regulator with XRE-family HTH domain